MSDWLHNQKLQVLAVILLSKILVYGIGFVLAVYFPLSFRYQTDFHHYFLDQRFLAQPVNFWQLWSYGDAQWYLDIADNGYISTPTHRQEYLATTNEPERKFAFFPLWPLLIRAVHLVVPQLTAAAFVATNVISILALYWTWRLLLLYQSDEQLAQRSLVLLIFFPFSIFYHLYFTESLFLLLAVVALYCLKRGQWLLGYGAAAALAVTKALGIFIALPIIGYVFHDVQRRKYQWLALPLIGLGLFAFSWYNQRQTGDWLYFSHVQEQWQNQPQHFKDNIIRNLKGLQFSNVMSLDWHAFHSSKVDVIVLVVTAVILVVSYIKLPQELWLFSVVLWCVPFLSKDLMSFSRYMSVSFPLFMYLAQLLKQPWWYYTVVLIFSTGWFYALLGVITWTWVG